MRLAGLALLASCAGSLHGRESLDGDEGPAPLVADPARQFVVGGTPTSGDPAVVALSVRRTTCDEDVAVFCTGTLVAPRVVLTAAHCLQTVRQPLSIEVLFGPDARAPEAVRLVVAQEAHPDWDDVTHADDLALLLLADDAPAPPVAWPTADVGALAPGAALRAVGYGVTDRDADDAGTKREGTLALGVVAASTFDAAPAPSMTCVGDSGGPVFATVDGVEQLVGVTSSGDFGCLEVAIQARVDGAFDSFVAPFLASAASAEALAAPDPAEASCEADCAVDDDCPAGMRCQVALDGGNSCALPGLAPGTFAGDCATDADCDGTCARLWPEDGAGACACYVPCVDADVDDTDPVDVADDTGAPPEGCGCASAAGPGSGAAWALLLVARRRRQGVSRP